MTVAELIEKLRELPQDMLVYGHDGEEGPYAATDAKIVLVGDCEMEEYVTPYGIRSTRPRTETYKQFDAVVIA